MGSSRGDIKLLGNAFLTLRNEVVESGALPTGFGGHSRRTEARCREGGGGDGVRRQPEVGGVLLGLVGGACGRMRDNATVTERD